MDDKIKQSTERLKLSKEFLKQFATKKEVV